MIKLQQKIEKLTSLGYSVKESEFNGKVYYFINGLGDLLMNSKKIKSSAWLTADGDVKVSVKETFKSNGVSQTWLNQRADEAVAKINDLIGEVAIEEVISVDAEQGTLNVDSDIVISSIESKKNVFQFAHLLRKAGLTWKLALKRAWAFYKKCVVIAVEVKKVLKEKSLEATMAVVANYDIKAKYNAIVKSFIYAKNCKHFRYVK